MTAPIARYRDLLAVHPFKQSAGPWCCRSGSCGRAGTVWSLTSNPTVFEQDFAGDANDDNPVAKHHERWVGIQKPSVWDRAWRVDAARRLLLGAKAPRRCADKRIMNSTSLLWLAVALLAIFAGAAVWWRQRQRLARLQDELREAQDSRLELIDEAQTLRLQLHASVKSPSGARAAASAALAEVAQRRAALDRALDAAAPAASGGWQDTLPMGQAPGFRPTEPASLATRPAELIGDIKH
jgi:hypothetical protein